MKTLNQTAIYFFIFSSVLFLQSCSQAGAEQIKIYNQLIIKAKKITKKFKLTDVDISCLKFSMLEGNVNERKIIDVREKHSKSCASDPNTSPRLFSIAIDESNGEIWSDAKSLLGQLEKLE